MVVYVDVLLLENYIVNLFLLIISFKVMKYKFSKLIYLGAGVGAIYTISFFLDNKIIISLPIKILVAFIMIYISCVNKNIKNIFKTIICFFSVSMILAGLCFYISISKGDYHIFKGINISSFSVKYLLLTLMILYIVIIRLIDYIKERNIVSSLIYDIELEINNKKIIFKGFLDTGNELREPITNLPCIIVEDSVLDELEITRDKLYYINYSTINEVSKIEGFKSENVRLKNDKDDWKTIQAIICICRRKLSNTNEFNALLSRGIL